MTVVAIDGPGGSGKSTVSRALAARLGLDRLDTGAMYRAVTLAALRDGIPADDGQALGALARALDLDVGAVDGRDRVLLAGDDVTEAIRGDDVNAVVSVVAAHPVVRAELVARQRAWVAARGAGVVEGRDITSVVLPDADVKVFLTADPAVRAARRAHEQAGGAPAHAAVQSAGAMIARRDRLDAGRATSPLVVADGAAVIDSTGKSVDEVVDEIWALVTHTATAPAPVPTTPAPVPTAPAPAAARPITRGELRFYAFCRVIAVGASRLWYPGKVLGAENLPPTGAYLLAPVHRSNVDWLIVARVTKRRLRYMVKGEVWKVKSVGRLLELLGTFPVQRGAADREALAHSAEILANGEPMVVFPEGTRGSGPVVGELRDGAAYLALRSGVPVVPVGVSAMERSMPRGAKFPRPVRVRIVVGPPICPGPVPVGASGRVRISRTATHEMSAQVRAGIQRAFDEAEGRPPTAPAAPATAAAQPGAGESASEHD